MQEKNHNAVIIPENLVRAVTKEMKRPNDSHALLALAKAIETGASHETKGGLMFVRGNHSDRKSTVAVIMNSLGKQSTPPILVAFTTLGNAIAEIKNNGKMSVFHVAAEEIRARFKDHALTDASGAVRPPAGCKVYFPKSGTMT